MRGTQVTLRTRIACCGRSRTEAPNAVPKGLGEPEVAVGSSRDATGAAAQLRQRELGDGPLRRDAPNAVPIALGEPEVAVGTSCDPKWARTGDEPEFGDDAPRRDASHPVTV